MADQRNIEYEDIFYRSMRTLVRIFCTNDSFYVVPSGDGFDHLPGVYGGCLRVNYREEIASSYRSAAMNALFVPHDVLITHKPDVDYVDKCPFLLHATKIDETGSCKLYMSSQTHSMVHLRQKELTAEMLAKSVQVENDENNKPLFFLNANSIFSSFKDNSHQHFLYCRRNCNLDSELDVMDVENDFLTAIHRKGTEICAARKQIAFFCSTWPEETGVFTTRSRLNGWPSQILIESARDKGCLLTITACQSPDKLCWRYDFSEAESVIISGVPANLRENMNLVSQLLNAYEDVCEPIPKKVIVSVFLTLLEEIDWSHLTSYPQFTKYYLERLKTIYEEGDCPDYFLPQNNLLLHYSEELEVDRLQVICTALDSINSLSTNHESTLNQVDKNDVLIEMTHMFHQMLCILFVWNHCMLHQKDDVTSIIQTHKDMLQRSQMLSIETCDYVEELITSSLGIAYMNKALKAFYSKEKQQFFTQSEHILRHDRGNVFGNVDKIHQMLLFVKTKKFKQAVEIFHENERKCMDFTLDNKLFLEDHNSYEEHIWGIVGRMAGNLGVVITDVEKAVYPAIVQKQIELCGDCMLSQPYENVAVLSSEFLLHYLYVMSVSESGQATMKKEDEQLNDSLEILEKYCRMDEQPDGNDKRPAAYLSLLANLYLNLGQRSMGLSLLKRACKHFSGPRNPAYWQVMSLKTESTRKRIYNVAGVVFIGSLLFIVKKFW